MAATFSPSPAGRGPGIRDRDPANLPWKFKLRSPGLGRKAIGKSQPGTARPRPRAAADSEGIMRHSLPSRQIEAMGSCV